MNNNVKLYLVGGALRNFCLRKPIKDLDFAVEAPDYATMLKYLETLGLHVWKHEPKFVSVRGRVQLASLAPFDAYLYGWPASEGQTINADFTLCRAETMYSDGRHPDSVTPADIYTDLARRDFTINAMAVGEDLKLIDPYDGLLDLADGQATRIDTVGEPADRFTEDPLRMFRAVRFAVLLNGYLSTRVHTYLINATYTLKGLPPQRIYDELLPALRHDWYLTMDYLMHYTTRLGKLLAEECPALWFKPSMDER